MQVVGWNIAYSNILVIMIHLREFDGSDLELLYKQDFLSQSKVGEI